jgi:hypothetical protein
MSPDEAWTLLARRSYADHLRDAVMQPKGLGEAWWRVFPEELLA